jgi:hypothetical protein
MQMPRPEMSAGFSNRLARKGKMPSATSPHVISQPGIVNLSNAEPKKADFFVCFGVQF